MSLIVERGRSPPPSGACRRRSLVGPSKLKPIDSIVIEPGGSHRQRPRSLARDLETQDVGLFRERQRLRARKCARSRSEPGRDRPCPARRRASGSAPPLRWRGAAAPAGAAIARARRRAVMSRSRHYTTRSRRGARPPPAPGDAVRSPLSGGGWGGQERTVREATASSASAGLRGEPAASRSGGLRRLVEFLAGVGGGVAALDVACAPGMWRPDRRGRASRRRRRRSAGMLPRGGESGAARARAAAERLPFRDARSTSSSAATRFHHFDSPAGVMPRWPGWRGAGPGWSSRTWGGGRT